MSLGRFRGGEGLWMNANIESLTVIDNGDGTSYNISSNPSLMTATEAMSTRSSTIQYLYGQSPVQGATIHSFSPRRFYSAAWCQSVSINTKNRPRLRTVMKPKNTEQMTLLFFSEAKFITNCFCKGNNRKI